MTSHFPDQVVDRSPYPEAPALAEGQLWDAIQSLRDGIMAYDRHERVVFYNDRLIELYPVLAQLQPLPGRTMEEVIACVGRMVASDDVAREAAALLARRRAEWPSTAGTPYSITLTDGRRMLVGERSTTDGGKVVIHTDVTAEMRAERRLVEALESLHNGFILFDADDRVVFANEPIREMFPGQREAMVPGTHIRDVIEAGIRNGDYRNYGSMAEGEYDAILRRHREGAVDGVERQLRDGRWIVIHQTVTPSGLRVGLRTDVTELKQRERELAAAHADLQRQTEELRRMADALSLARARAEAADRAKTEFLAVVGHELRTPFIGIRGMADLLADAPLGAGHRRYLDAMRRSTASLLGLLDQIIDYSQGELGHIERRDTVFDPALLAAESASLFQALALERGLDLHVACEPALPTRLLGDEGKTRQILLNLISNALKFTDAGSVSVSVSLERGDAGTALRYEVRDTGIGLSPEGAARLFEPFRRIDGPARGGSGLGLAICKRLAEALGGAIGVRSRPGAGASFWFTVAVAPAGDPMPEAASDEDRSATGRTVLLAEDDPTSRLLLATLLGQWGYAVVEAADGQAALDALAGQPFAAVVMDVNLPVMDGPEAVRRLRGGAGPNRTVPVIGLTAEADVHRPAARAGDGFSLMMGKPFDIEQLRAAIDRAAADGRSSAQVPRALA